MSRPDYYKILGLSRTASEHDIKAAYRHLALRYHPDLHPNNPQAVEILKLINEAYDVLGDAQQRRHYDAQMAPAIAMPQYAPPYSASQPIYYNTTQRRTFSLFQRRTVLVIWIVGLLAVFAFSLWLSMHGIASTVPVRRQLEFVTSTPYDQLLFIDTLGVTYLSQAATPKEHLRAGQTLIISYTTAIKAGRVFIGVKGNKPQAGSTAPFASGQWFGQNDRGALKIPITQTDDYVVFLNPDQFVGAIKMNWAIKEP